MDNCVDVSTYGRCRFISPVYKPSKVSTLNSMVTRYVSCYNSYD